MNSAPVPCFSIVGAVSGRSLQNNALPRYWMTARGKCVPEVLIALTCLGMSKFRRNLGQRAQYETEAQYIRPWQSDRRLVQYQIVVEQQVDIERSR